MPNVALNKNADASSSVYPYTPAKAVDGVTTPLGRWVGSSPLPPSPNWLRIDLGANYWINRWVVRQMGAVGWSPNFNLIDYKLQGSLDNANWYDMDTVTNNSANQTDRAITPRKARWVRVYVTNGLRCNTNFASIVDLEVYDAPNPPSLTGLTLKSGTTNIPLSPGFSPSTYSYNASVTEVASVAVTPSAATGMVIRVNNNVVTSGQPYQVSVGSGDTNIPITVTSPDGSMVETYTITVTKTVKSAYLTGLTLTARGASMTPGFNKTTMYYDATVAPNAATCTVTPTAEDPTATIKVNNVTVPSGSASGDIPLAWFPEITNIAIDVTAANNSSTQHYVIAVIRPIA